MKTILIILVTLFLTSMLFSQTGTMLVHTNAGTSSFQIADIVSITFSTDTISGQGLVAHYLFNGDASDLSGKGNNGSTNGGVTWGSDRFGTPNQAANFDGSGYIRVPNSPSLNDSSITVCAWIFPTGVGTDNEWDDIVSKGYNTNSSGEFSLYRLDLAGTLGVGIIRAGSPDYTSSSDTLHFNQWRFVAFSYNQEGRIVKLYVDSILTNTDVVSPARQITSNAINIGRRETTTGGSQFLFHGAIDDIRIYNRALSDNEIKAVYHEGGW